MEICRQDLVSQCQPGDWKVGFDVNGNSNLDDAVSFDVNGDGTVDINDKEKDIKTYQLGQAIASAPDYTASVLSNWDTQFGTSPNRKNIRERLGAGDTGNKLALVAADQRYPRRVAFARNNTNQLVSASGAYKPIGVGCPLDTTGTGYNNNGCTYTTSSPTEGTHYGKKGSSALWFRTTSFSSSNPVTNPTYSNDNSLFYYPPIDADGNSSPDLDGQPLLVPVLQIHDANNIPPNLRTDGTDQLQDQFRTNWIRLADADTTFNATLVLGNSPSRSDEVSAGLQNLVRFLENWNGKTVKISGSFIQLKRSSYSTAPLAPIFTNKQTVPADNSTNNLSLFQYALDLYPTPNVSGIAPFYSPPNRTWGFDVALLSEQPDLFAQRFTLPPAGRPNEFFREVSRDDRWVQTLLCAGQASNQTGITASGTTVTYSRAVPTEYRPSSCPSIPDN